MTILPILSVAIVAVLFLGLRQRISLLRTGVKTEGTIVALETEGLQFMDKYPVVRFKTPQGEWLTLRSQTSGRAQNWKVGQQVEVRYPHSRPENFIVVSGLDLLI
jgi:hypothetical protein